MAKGCDNPYKTARKAAGLTQDRAAMLLNVSVDSLRDYESNLRPVPNDVAAAMCDAYDAQYLAIAHLRMTSIGRQAMTGVENTIMLEPVDAGELQAAANTAIRDADAMNVDQEYRLTLLELGITDDELL